MSTTKRQPTIKRLKDSQLKGGVESVREPVVTITKARKVRRATNEIDGKKAYIASDRDEALQVRPARKPKIVRGEHWNDNGRVYLTGLDLNTHGPVQLRAEAFKAFLDSLVATADPLDRAHTHRRKIFEDAPEAIDESFVLLDHQQIDHPLDKNGRRTGKPKKTTRRRYHPSQLTSSGVAFDSMYDAAFDIARTFQAVGINLGWEVLREGDASRAEHDRNSVVKGLSRDGFRSVLAPRIRDMEMDEGERKLQAEASAMLRKAGFKELAED